MKACASLIALVPINRARRVKKTAPSLHPPSPACLLFARERVLGVVVHRGLGGPALHEPAQRGGVAGRGAVVGERPRVGMHPEGQERCLAGRRRRLKPPPPPLLF